MKRIICTVLIVLLILSLVACSPREVISVEAFVSRMEDAGFEVFDMTEETQGEVAAWKLATGDQFEIEFYVFETDQQARQAYNQIKRHIEDGAGNVRSHSEVNLANYGRFRMTSGGMFSVVSRIEHTLVFVNTDADNRDDVDAILERLGY